MSDSRINIPSDGGYASARNRYQARVDEIRSRPKPLTPTSPHSLNPTVFSQQQTPQLLNRIQQWMHQTPDADLNRLWRYSELSQLFDHPATGLLGPCLQHLGWRRIRVNETKQGVSAPTFWAPPGHKAFQGETLTPEAFDAALADFGQIAIKSENLRGKFLHPIKGTPLRTRDIASELKARGWTRFRGPDCTFWWIPPGMKPSKRPRGRPQVRDQIPPSEARRNARLKAQRAAKPNI